MAPESKPSNVTPIRRSWSHRGWRASIRKELRESRSVWITIGGITLLGPFLANMIFPNESLGMIIGGGLMLGVVFGMCALAGRILE